jgi:hypothetical protein
MVLASSLMVRTLFELSLSELVFTVLAVMVPVPGLNVNVELTFADVIVPDTIPVKGTKRSLLSLVSDATVEPALVNKLPSPTKLFAVTVLVNDA